MNFGQRDSKETYYLWCRGIGTQAITLLTSGSSSDGGTPPPHPPINRQFLLYYLTVLSAAMSITSISLSSSPFPHLPPSGLMNRLTHTCLEHKVTDVLCFSLSVWNYLALQYKNGPRLERLPAMKTIKGWNKLDTTLW